MGPIRRRKAGFTLVEIMMVVLIIGILLSIAVPQWIRARERSQSKTCISNLRQIDSAKEIFAQETSIPNGGPVNQGDLWPTYIRGSSFPACPAGGAYTIGVIGAYPACSITTGLYPHIL